MNVDFNFDKINSLEFGIGCSNEQGKDFSFLPVDKKLQEKLSIMSKETYDKMLNISDTPNQYEVSENYSSKCYVYIPLIEDSCIFFKNLHESVNMSVNLSAIRNVNSIFCYFVRFIDSQGRKLTALRRAVNFKGVVKQKGRLIRLLDDTLQVIEDTVFKLDGDFDILIDSHNIHILRPSSFEFLGNLQELILMAAGSNLKKISQDLSYIDFFSIEKVAGKKIRIARYIAAISARKDLKNIDRSKLEKLCRDANIKISLSGAKIKIEEGFELAFLQLLDRRRYNVDLVKGSSEHFFAYGRKSVK